MVQFHHFPGQTSFLQAKYFLPTSAQFRVHVRGPQVVSLQNIHNTSHWLRIHNNDLNAKVHYTHHSPYSFLRYIASHEQSCIIHVGHARKVEQLKTTMQLFLMWHCVCKQALYFGAIPATKPQTLSEDCIVHDIVVVECPSLYTYLSSASTLGFFQLLHRVQREVHTLCSNLNSRVSVSSPTHSVRVHDIYTLFSTRQPHRVWVSEVSRPACWDSRKWGGQETFRYWHWQTCPVPTQSHSRGNIEYCIHISNICPQNCLCGYCYIGEGDNHTWNLEIGGVYSSLTVLKLRKGEKYACNSIETSNKWFSPFQSLWYNPCTLQLSYPSASSLPLISLSFPSLPSLLPLPSLPPFSPFPPSLLPLPSLSDPLPLPSLPSSLTHLQKILGHGHIVILESVASGKTLRVFDDGRIDGTGGTGALGKDHLTQLDLLPDL